jgi:23S rRNA (pseudouridine1915-N3)-methyltransferase
MILNNINDCYDLHNQIAINMKLLLLFVGKTTEPYLREGIDIYKKRLPNYISVSTIEVPVSTSKEKNKSLTEESKNIQSKLLPGDFLVILDENGTQLGSRQLATLLQKWMIQSIQRVVFIVGGPYGISEALKKQAKYSLSLSKFTFTHQMVRLILVEQLYRAMTIIKNEGYHHD